MLPRLQTPDEFALRTARDTHYLSVRATVAELADAQDLGSCGETRGSSSLPGRISVPRYVPIRDSPAEAVLGNPPMTVTSWGAPPHRPAVLLKSPGIC